MRECAVHISEVAPENFRGYRLHLDGSGFVKFTMGESVQTCDRVYVDVTPPSGDQDQIPDLILDQLETIHIDPFPADYLEVSQELLESVSSKLQEYFKGKGPGNLPLFSLEAYAGPVKFSIDPLFRYLEAYESGEHPVQVTRQKP